ncbi:MAG TPA: xanthine dehydrogenase family protein subunit M [Vicinamibacterales bacterium]|nr:xanthine dehydrogenase family protein subunit M [Vicinamibacterales bacterium]
MIPAAFEYERATSVDDALAKLKAAGVGGKLLAGGHSLIPLMKLRLSEPGVLIDIARIPGLAGIGEKDGRIQVGAATVHADLAASPALQQKCPVLAEAASEIGDPQVRNRGTIGGSLAHADPSADYPAVMLALDADIHLKSSSGERVVKAGAFFKDLFSVDLGSDEIIVSVQFTPVRASGYAKLHQRASHYAIVGVAAALEVKDGVIQAARVGLTGAGPHAVRLPDVEKALSGKSASADTIAAASKSAGSDLTSINSDLHAGEEYRRAMIPVFARRALERALARA